MAGNTNKERFSVQSDTAIVAKPNVGVKKPSLYKVMLHNDDFTPMDFVVDVLEQIFRKDNSAAVKIMLDVHNRGIGVCGTYTYDVAETKVRQVKENADSNQFPLKCTMEKE